MSMHASLLLLLISTSAYIFEGGTANSLKTPFTCSAGNFNIGQRGSVTCYFGPDIYNSKYDFEVKRYPFDAPSSFVGHDIMRCHQVDGQPICIVSDGFFFNGVRKEHVKISIPNITRDVGGKYACQLIPADGRKKKRCELTVKEWPVEAPSPPPTEMQPDSCPEKGQNQGPLILAILFGVVLAASLLGNVILLLLYIRQPKNIRPHEQSDRIGNTLSIPLLGGGEPEKIDTTNNERPFTMPAIRPHNDNDDEGKEHRIVLPPPTLKSRPVTMPGKRPYNDNDDKGKEIRTVPPTPIPFTMPVIRPYNENDDDEGKEKLIDPPTPPSPIGSTRRPYRRPYHRHA